MRDAGAGRAAQIKTQVVPVRMVLGFEGPLASLGEIQELMDLFASCIPQKCNVAVRHDEDVAGGVREQVQQDEGVPGTAQDEVIVVAPLGQDRAEDAVGPLGAADLVDIIETPWCPEAIHYSSHPDSDPGSRTERDNPRARAGVNSHFGASAGRADARRRDEVDVGHRRGAATKPIRALRRRAPSGCGPQARWLCCSLLTYRPGYSSSLAARQRAWGPAAKCEFISARALRERYFLNRSVIWDEDAIRYQSTCSYGILPRS